MDLIVSAIVHGQSVTVVGFMILFGHRVGGITRIGILDHIGGILSTEGEALGHIELGIETAFMMAFMVLVFIIMITDIIQITEIRDMQAILE